MLIVERRSFPRATHEFNGRFPTPGPTESERPALANMSYERRPEACNANATRMTNTGIRDSEGTVGQQCLSQYWRLHIRIRGQGGLETWANPQIVIIT